MSERFELRVDAELLRRVDEARGDVPRAVWVRRAIEARLPGDRAGLYERPGLVERSVPVSRAEAFRQASQRRGE